MKEKLWACFQRLKFKELYYMHFQRYVEGIDNLISAICLITSAAAIANWAIWKTVPNVWSIIIAISQIVVVLKPLYPFSKQLTAMKYAIPEMKALLNNFESDWNCYHLNKQSDEEALLLLNKYNTAFKEIDLHYSCEQMTPTRRLVKRLADRDYKLYFERNHSVKEWR